MARVEAFEVDGIEMIFFSNDHEPPHFHARRPGEWSVKVLFLLDGDEMFEGLRPRDARLPRNMRRAIASGVEANREALLAQWEAIH